MSYERALRRLRVRVPRNVSSHASCRSGALAVFVCALVRAWRVVDASGSVRPSYILNQPRSPAAGRHPRRRGAPVACSCPCTCPRPCMRVWRHVIGCSCLLLLVRVWRHVIGCVLVRRSTHDVTVSHPRCPVLCRDGIQLLPPVTSPCVRVASLLHPSLSLCPLCPCAVSLLPSQSLSSVIPPPVVCHRVDTSAQHGPRVALLQCTTQHTS